MDRAISPATHTRRRRRQWLIGTAALLLVVAGLLAFRSVLQPSIRRDQILTTKVEIGDVEASLTAAGVIIPGREAVITSPIQSTIRRVALQVGEKVQPGQTILELDKELTTTALAKLQDEQQQNRNKDGQLQLTLEKALNDLESQEKVQQVKVRSLQSTLRDEQYLLKIGGGTAESVRQAELNLKVAQLELQRLGEQIRNQRAANAADKRELGFTMQIQDRSITELAGKLAQANISSQQPGVLTWVNEDIGTTVNQGDALARVADLSRFRVRASISDTYADALHLGDAVVVRVNDTDLRGTVTTVSPAVDKGVVTFYAKLTDDHHPALRANLRADVFVVTKAQHKVVRVKNGPFYQGGKEQAVFVLRDGKAEQRTVRFGDSNFDYVQIISGLQPGDEIVLSELKEYKDTPSLTIKD
ncbi:efflux RND transporter periplasmic adaptor subunit [Hymenobacter cellulosilyticus]|uniref:HlyD family efflux transporter periplasmic adaptor subunit n=1 Tax=Hymenobacter cellulosilyticus TaxID=2932248 RepID=A0A8T9QAD8_9BACT|nr:HlyD family efflux transporter periplasmic adaptor subunit [Hymenobacter cellulosilyticus]UOQ72780.1 HlyD family efflux transporter periplasmic adaptor subunit [Hymenobacter cellulosilyticus]